MFRARNLRSLDPLLVNNCKLSSGIDEISLGVDTYDWALTNHSLAPTSYCVALTRYHLALNLALTILGPDLLFGIDQ